jgi:hypothetical protein
MRRPSWLTVLVLVVAAGACSVWKTVPLIPDTGGHPAQMRLKGSLKMTGIVKITLPGDRVLEGRWDEVGASTDLEEMTVPTPRGDVSAADLAGDEGPSLIVNLRGDGLRMICVCTGDDVSGYTGTCIDSDGTRWRSTHRF